MEVTLEGAPALPVNWPAAWLEAESAGAVVRFVDSAHDAAKTAAEIRKLFPGTRAFEAKPMSLRAIFVALARGKKKAA